MPHLLLITCRLVDQLESLAPSVPSLIQCTSLTVKGPVRFEGGVAIRGDVTLTNGRCPTTGCVAVEGQLWRAGDMGQLRPAVAAVGAAGGGFVPPLSMDALPPVPGSGVPFVGGATKRGGGSLRRHGPQMW